VGEAYIKARELSKRVGDPGMHLAALYGLWAVSLPQRRTHRDAGAS